MIMWQYHVARRYGRGLVKLSLSGRPYTSSFKHVVSVKSLGLNLVWRCHPTLPCAHTSCTKLIVHMLKSCTEYGYRFLYRFYIGDCYTFPSIWSGQIIKQNLKHRLSSTILFPNITTITFHLLFRVYFYRCWWTWRCTLAKSAKKRY